MSTRLERIEYFNNGNNRVLRIGGKVNLLTVREINHIVALVGENGDSGEIAYCECCLNLGYVEVETDTGTEIEACETCDYFGIIGDNEYFKNKALEAYELDRGEK